ncbi:PREDICTED: exocyst complex component EXO84A [Tarenaya hassleriana]|uniref:exocyst complex component EXO84A n=1 Tax=Tarenaya hassleriana TaxID=28532 RepID=UPI00053C36F6|nr:PREDICTED: exocyst complex component EXO84A [Tarenaya hassleriana]
MEGRTRGSMSSSIGDSADLEANLTLSDRLKVFKSSGFDPDSYVTSKCQHMNEKEIRHLCSYLVELKKASAEEMRKSVYANYAAFIRTSKEISALEGQLLSMRNLLSAQAALVHGLADGVHISSLCADDADDLTDEVLYDIENKQLSSIENWVIEFFDRLEVLLAEKRVEEAMAALEEGRQVAAEANERRSLSPNALLSLNNAIREKRQELADQLAESICQPSTRAGELRSTVLALKKLGDGPRAHTLLLRSYEKRLQANIQSLRASNTSYGVAFAAALSQLVFSTIAQASSDSLAVVGEEEPAYSSELVTWSVKQAESFALLLKRHTLASSAAAGSLRVTAECIQLCSSHCSLLESRGLALAPVLLKHFRPCVEQALTGNLKRIEQSSAALAASDDWMLTYTPTGSRASSTAQIAPHLKLSVSAIRFNSMVQEFLEDAGPLDEVLQLDGVALDGVLQVFNAYVDLLINALPGSAETEENPVHRIVKVAETEAQQTALLANALLLADELIPRSASKILSSNTGQSTPSKDRQNRPEQREWKRKLQRSVDRLRDSFCRQHALELIFTEEGEVRLSSQMYIAMDEIVEEPEWFPSPIFQELFAKLTRIASIASDMFVGRERFATILLMRLMETVILWISDDQTFWEEIETGPKPLGPHGLQQFYLDMEFVMIFASQGRYLSRNLHQVIKNIIARAIEAVAATGLDPYRTLPEDEWFAEVAQIAIKMLTGKANFGGHVERDVTSPSVSSAKSYTSN